MCGPPCTMCNKHVYCHGPGEYRGLCYGCYAIAQNIPEEDLTRIDGKIHPVHAIVHTFESYKN